MLFTSISFLYYFLPALIIIYFITPKKYKNIILLIASLLFYLYGEPKYVFLMIAEIIIAYIGAILIDKYKNQSKNILITTLVIHIFLLIIFKYTDFIIQSINDISNANIKLLNIALPIGISFYTFQIISYLIDVYNGKVKVQKNIINLATYVSLFPQLVAGPIVRYQTVEKELDDRVHSFNNFAYGIRRFSIGLAKKVLIANALGELCTKAFALNETTVIFYWIFGISYMLQLYFDFSAYSDMAIGLGRIFGFNFPENFNYPYISKSITEFWRRWHISLSTWFKDYVYIPLGGNKDGKYKQIRNILIVWLLTGIWHGANWTFLIWGLLFGILLIIEKIFLNKFMEKLPSFIRRIYVLFIVMVLFVIFNADNMSEALINIKGLFGMNGEVFINDYTLHYLKSYLPILIIAIFGATPFIKTLIDKLTINYKELNLLDDGIIFNKILVDYLFNLEQSERELFGKNKVYCTKDSGYIINLINYYTDIYDNVDYSIASAIGEIESGFTSRYMLNNNNIFGGMANGRLISYKSIEYGTLMYIKMLSDGYFGKGFNTVELIGIIYNPMFNENGVKVAKPTWVNNVKRAMEKYSVKEKLDVTVFN